MTQEEYSRHLSGQLCWYCHCPTHASHARQRQCPQCRKKWSYARRQLEWRLAELFCQGLNAHKASKLLNISYQTAWAHYLKFESSLRKLISVEGLVFSSMKSVQGAMDFIFILDRKLTVQPEYQNKALHLIFLTLIKSVVPGKNSLPKKRARGGGGDFLMIS